MIKRPIEVSNTSGITKYLSYKQLVNIPDSGNKNRKEGSSYVLSCTLLH